MWPAILKFALSLADRLTAWAKEDSDQNIGRQLQQTDNLRASVKGDCDAAKTRADVAGLSDDALDSELRGSTPAAGS